MPRKRLAPSTEPFPYPDPAKISGDQAFNVRLAELAKLERDTVKYEELRARLASRTVPTLPASLQKSEQPLRPSSGRGNRASATRAAGRRTSVPVHDRLSRSMNGSLTNRRSSVPSSVGNKSSTTAQHERNTHHSSLNITTEESRNSRSPSPSCAITSSQSVSKVNMAEESTDSAPQRVKEKDVNEETRSDIGEWKVIANINNHPVEVTLSGGPRQTDRRADSHVENTSTVPSNGSSVGGQERESHVTEKSIEPEIVGEGEGEVEGEVTSQRAGGEDGGEGNPVDDCGTNGSFSLKDSDSTSPNTTVSPPVNASGKRSTTKPAKGTASHKPASQSPVSSSPRQTTPPTDGSSHSSTSSSSLASEHSERPAPHTHTRQSKSHRSPTKSGRSKKHSSKSRRQKRESHQ